MIYDGNKKGKCLKIPGGKRAPIEFTPKNDIGAQGRGEVAKKNRWDCRHAVGSADPRIREIPPERDILYSIQREIRDIGKFRQKWDMLYKFKKGALLMSRNLERRGGRGHLWGNRIYGAFKFDGV